jgi:molybdopterin converting factor small subunit
VKLLYFAWVRQKVGAAEEEVSPPAEVRDVAGLIAWLATRSAGHAAAFADPRQVRAAVNQDFATARPAGGAGRRGRLSSRRSPEADAVAVTPTVRVGEAHFDLGAEAARLTAGPRRCRRPGQLRRASAAAMTGSRRWCSSTTRA